MKYIYVCAYIVYNLRKHRRKSTVPKPGFLYAERQAQVNVRFDHPNSVSKPQAFGRLIFGFFTY